MVVKVQSIKMAQRSHRDDFDDTLDDFSDLDHPEFLE